MGIGDSALRVKGKCGGILRYPFILGRDEIDVW